MVGIYALRLEEDKYYIGKTYKTIEERLLEHYGKQGSAWTRRYKPLELLEFYENMDDYDEDKLTKIYMAKYGIDNVRGGAYCRMNIDCHTMKLLKRELWNAQNKCMECGSEYHYISQCEEYVKSINKKREFNKFEIFLLASNIFLILIITFLYILIKYYPLT